MPIYEEDGKEYEDHFNMLLDNPTASPDEPTAGENLSSNTPGNEPLRITIRPTAPEKPADALKSDGGTERTLLNKLTGNDGGERYQLWPEKAVRSIIESMKLPAEVYAGNIDPMSDEGIRKAADFALNLGAGGLSTAPLRDGVGMFGGRLTKEAVSLAENMQRHGMSEQAIKQMSGLEKNAAGVWVREFSDAGSVYNPEEFKLSNKRTEVGNWSSVDTGKEFSTHHARLEDIFQHTELYKAYPELKDMLVQLVANKKDLGTYYPSGFERIELRAGLSPEEAKSTLLHEIQHYIQKDAGYLVSDQSLPAHLNDQLKGSLLKKYGSAVMDEIDNLYDKGDVQAATDLAKRALKSVDYRLYANAIVEAESRNVQKRMKMTPKDIQKSLGKETEDVERNYQYGYNPLSHEFIAGKNRMDYDEAVSLK